MITSIEFEIQVPVMIGAQVFDGLVVGVGHMAEFMYGEDRDGNRGEKRHELDCFEIDHISYEEEDGSYSFIRKSKISNMGEIEKSIFNYCLDFINS